MTGSNFWLTVIIDLSVTTLLQVVAAMLSESVSNLFSLNYYFAGSATTTTVSLPCYYPDF